MDDCTKPKKAKKHLIECQTEEVDHQQQTDEGSSLSSSLLQHSEPAEDSRHQTTDVQAASNAGSKEDVGLESKEIGGPRNPQTVNIAPIQSWENDPQIAVVGTRFPMRIPIYNPLGYIDNIPQALKYNYGQMQGSSGSVPQTASTTPFDPFKYLKGLPPSNPFGLDPPWDPFLKGELPPGFREAWETMPGANIPLPPIDNTMTRAEIGDEAFDRFVEIFQDTENDRPEEDGDVKYVVDGDTIKWG